MKNTQPLFCNLTKPLTGLLLDHSLQHMFRPLSKSNSAAVRGQMDEELKEEG